VVAATKHCTGAAEDPIHSARDARADRFHPASECSLILRFDEDVNVISLDRELCDAEAAALARRSEAAADFLHEDAPSQ
jgi:hypothetical protein